MLDRGQPVSLDVVKKDGSVMHLNNCVSLRYDYNNGTRNVKLMDSRQIRLIRDNLIIAINDIEVYI
jgi:hypothetical protein